MPGSRVVQSNGPHRIHRSVAGPAITKHHIAAECTDRLPSTFDRGFGSVEPVSCNVPSERAFWLEEVFAARPDDPGARVLLPWYGRGRESRARPKRGQVSPLSVTGMGHTPPRRWWVASSLEGG